MYGNAKGDKSKETKIPIKVLSKNSMTGIRGFFLNEIN